MKPFSPDLLEQEVAAFAPRRFRGLQEILFRDLRARDLSEIALTGVLLARAISRKPRDLSETESAYVSEARKIEEVREWLCLLPAHPLSAP